ncbi:MAG: hypothetical protein AB7F86_19195 [Bdellovibrionales bacterium]
MTLFAALYSLSAVAAPERTRQNFRVESQPSEYRLPLKIYNLSPANWSRQDLRFQLSEVNRIFAQCGVQVDQITLDTIETADLNRKNWDVPDILKMVDTLIGWREFDQSVVTLFFVQGVVGRLDKLTSTGIAFHPAWTRAPKDVENFADLNVYMANGTAWITAQIKNPEYQSWVGPGYNTTAHEIAHVVLDSGHVEGQEVSNLLSGHRGRNDKLTETQCLRMRQSRYVKPRF